MKKLILSVLLMQVMSPLVHAETLSREVHCQKAFGNPIFDSLLITFSAEKAGNSSRKVEVSANYHHSGIDSNFYHCPIKAETTVNDLANGTLKLKFSDDVQGNNDYSGGTIDLSVFDSQLGRLAVIKYMSDGIDAFGVLSCTDLPKF